MKKYYFIIIGLIILLGGIIYIFYHHSGRLRKIYMIFKTNNLVYNSKQISGSLNYRLYTPKNDKSDQLPLILYLHGAGQRGSENRKQLDYAFYKFSSFLNQKKHPCYVLAPQCPSNKEWVNRSNKSIPFTHYLQDDTNESPEMELILELIKDLITNYPIDINRIYVTGFSMGATGVWDMISRYPNVFAGAAIFSGVSDTTKAHLITQIPIWAFSGEKDNIAPVKLNEEMCKAINANNGNCRFTRFDNVGHDCLSKALENTDIIEWLFSNEKMNNN